MSDQRIRFDDVDGAGIVYYPRFFHLCHATFEDCFNDQGPCTYQELIGVRRRGFPTVHLEADFQRPLKYGDVARVSMLVEHLGRSSTRFRYEIRRNAEEALAFVGRVVTVFTDIDTLESLPLDDDIRAALQAHLVAPPQ